ncbi:MAG: type III pantothenate kinase, partial [Rhodospirillales bacterium]|nr:type III pantothenate kinase [Rhodospirillales bacterium]
AIFNSAGEIEGEWRAATDTNRTADEFGVWLGQLMDRDGIDPKDVTGSVIATVVPANLINLQALCRNGFGTEPLVVGRPEVDLGLEVLIDHPNEVGADRLCNSVAAHEQFPGSLLVIDFGTATSFDLIDSDGNYRGGVIVPGINLSLEALHQGAAQLPRIAVERPVNVVGSGTITAMQSGIFWGHVSIIEGMVSRIAVEFGSPLTVIATGGVAAMFMDATSAIQHWAPDLTLHGLYAIHQRNQEK